MIDRNSNQEVRVMYYGIDPTYILVVIGFLICLLASAKMKSTFSRYSRVRNHSGMTGREAAERILNQAGIYDVREIGRASCRERV